MYKYAYIFFNNGQIKIIFGYYTRMINWKEVIKNYSLESTGPTNILICFIKMFSQYNNNQLSCNIYNIQSFYLNL